MSKTPKKDDKTEKNKTPSKTPSEAKTPTNDVQDKEKNEKKDIKKDDKKNDKKEDKTTPKTDSVKDKNEKNDTKNTPRDTKNTPPRKTEPTPASNKGGQKRSASEAPQESYINSGEPRIVTCVLIENFPSRQELFDLIDKYLESNEMPKHYRGYNKGSSLELHFENPVTLF